MCLSEQCLYIPESIVVRQDSTDARDVWDDVFDCEVRAQRKGGEMDIYERPVTACKGEAEPIRVRVDVDNAPEHGRGTESRVPVLANERQARPCGWCARLMCVVHVEEKDLCEDLHREVMDWCLWLRQRLHDWE